MSSISINGYLNKLDDFANATMHILQQLERGLLIESQAPTLKIEKIIENNSKDPKFKINAHVRILRYKNLFAKGYTPNLSEDIL